MPVKRLIAFTGGCVVAYFMRFMVYCIRHCGMFALIFPIFVFFSIGAGFGALERCRALALLEEDGVPTVGEVSALRESDAGDMGQKDPQYFVTCRFRAGEEQVERETRVADETWWRSLRKGDAVDIRYSASDPAVWDIPDTRRSAGAERFMVWACFIAGGVSVTLYLLLWAAQVCVNRRWPEPECIGHSVGPEPGPPV